MLNLINNIDIALIIKRNNFKTSFTQQILNIFECNENEIEKKLFEIKEIKQFIASNQTDIFFDKVLRINEKNKKLEFIGYKDEDLLSIIIIDVTIIHHSYLISKTLFKLNKLIHIKEENELFQKTVDLILESANFDATFIMINKNNILKPIAWGNTVEDNLNCIKNIQIPLNGKSPALNTPVAQAFLRGEIVINDNSKINPNIEVLKDEMLKKDYLSSIGIPIFKNNKPYGAICICHNEINFFSKFKELFNEISNIISYVLDIIEENKFTNILKQAIDISYEWIIITDKKGIILYINDMVTEKSAYSKDELIGKNTNIFLKNNKIYESIEHKMKNNEIYEDIINYKIKDNKQLFFLSKFIPYNNYVIYMGKDITNEKKYKKLLNNMKNRDSLTGFLTKNAFIKEVQKTITLSLNKKHLLITTDINNFSYFNIEYGKRIGDLLFVEISKDINKILNKYENNIIIAKNNDGFLVFVEDIQNEQLIEVNKILEYFFNKTYIIDNLKLVIDYNAGISIYPKDGKNINKLLELANIALKKAKLEGINNYTFYNNEFLTQIKHQKNAIALIEEALKNDEFILFYQPHIDAQSQKIIGAESLLRIKKNNEIISPYHFIEELEKSNYIQQIDMDILNKIDKKLSQTNLKISFNLSLKSFNNENIINRIIEIAQKHPNKLEVELLERTLINDSEYTKEILNKFKQNTILIAMDDFGTGYSSLSYLIKFPIDILKIDISFIQTMLTNKISFEIVKTTINLCKELNIISIVEGVETKEQYLVLKTLGCDYIQGFYFYKPMNEQDFLKLLNSKIK